MSSHPNWCTRPKKVLISCRAVRILQAVVWPPTGVVGWDAGILNGDGGKPNRLLKYPLRKRKAMLGEFDFFEFLFAF